MRILFLTNFYQTPGSGGEEQSCRQVVEGLRRRGHTALVLTSMHGAQEALDEAAGISRSLYLEMDLSPWRHSMTFFTQRRAREDHDLKCFERVMAQFQPDIIFIWGMWNLPRSLAALAEARYPDGVVYRFASYWPTLPTQHELYWRTPGRHWFSRLPKWGLARLALAILARDSRPPDLQYRHVICVSAASRNKLIEAGIPVQHASVIFTGLDIDLYTPTLGMHQGHADGGLKLLYAGRLSPDKGISTAIEAVAKLVADGQYQLTLSLVGSGSPDFEASLRRHVKLAKLADHVSFLGWVPPEHMPGLLREFDVILVPSLWEEPLARVLLEGMISSLAVVATPTGGTPEIISDGINGLLFRAGDSNDLADKIAQLARDPETRRRLASAGRQTVLEKFTISKMMDEIERLLLHVVATSADKQAYAIEPG